MFNTSLEMFVILSLFVVSVVGYSVCPWHVECIPGCVKLDQRGCKMCACGPMMFHPGAGYRGMPGGMVGGASFTPGTLGGGHMFGSVQGGSKGESHAVTEKPLKECPGTMLCMMTCKGHYSLSKDVQHNGCRSCTCPKETHTSVQVIVAKPSAQPKPQTSHMTSSQVVYVQKPATHTDCTGTKLCMMTCKGKYILGDHGSDGCQSCACIPEPAPIVVKPVVEEKKECHETVLCMLSCKHGYTLSPKCNDGCHNECQKCSCIQPTPAPVIAIQTTHKVECPKTLECMLRCKDGYHLGSKDTNGCPECKCLAPQPIQLVYEVKCPQALTCSRGCSVGYKCSKDGCPTCECIQPQVVGVLTVHEIHTTQQVTCKTALTCPKSCTLGYKCGVDGCPTCECLVQVHTATCTDGCDSHNTGTGSLPMVGNGAGPFSGIGQGTGPFSGNGQGAGTSSGNGQGSGPFSGNGQGAGPFSGNGQGAGTSSGNGQGSGPFSEIGQGTGPSSGNGQGVGPFSGNGQGAGTSSGNGQGAGPFSGNGQGTGPFSGNGQGSGPLSGNGQGTVSGSGNGAGPFAGNNNGQGPFSGIGSSSSNGNGTGQFSGNGPYAGSINGLGAGPGSSTGAGSTSTGNGAGPFSVNSNGQGPFGGAATHNTQQSGNYNKPNQGQQTATGSQYSGSFSGSGNTDTNNQGPFSTANNGHTPLHQIDGGGTGSVSQSGNYNNLGQAGYGSSPFTAGNGGTGNGIGGFGTDGNGYGAGVGHLTDGSGGNIDGGGGSGPFSIATGAGLGGHLPGAGTSGGATNISGGPFTGTASGPFAVSKTNGSSNAGPFASGLGTNWQNGSGNGKGWSTGGTSGPFSNGQGSGHTAGQFHNMNGSGYGTSPSNGFVGQTSSGGSISQSGSASYGLGNSNQLGKAPGTNGQGPFSLSPSTGGPAKNDSGLPMSPYSVAAGGSGGLGPFASATGGHGGSGTGSSPFAGGVGGTGGTNGHLTDGSGGNIDQGNSGLGANPNQIGGYGGSNIGSGPFTSMTSGQGPSATGTGQGPSTTGNGPGSSSSSTGQASGGAATTDTSNLLQILVNCPDTLKCMQTCDRGYNLNTVDTQTCPVCTCVGETTSGQTPGQGNIIQETADELTYGTLTTCDTNLTCHGHCGYGYKTDGNGCPTCDCDGSANVTSLKPVVVQSTPAPVVNPQVSTLISKCPDCIKCMSTCAHGYTLGTEGPDGCPSCTCINPVKNECHDVCTTKPALTVHTCDAALQCMASCTNGYTLGQTGSDGCPRCTCKEVTCNTGCEETHHQIVQLVPTTDCGSSSCEHKCTENCQTTSGGQVLHLIAGGSSSSSTGTISGGSGVTNTGSGGGGGGGGMSSGMAIGGAAGVGQCRPLPPNCHAYCIKYDVAHCRVCTCESSSAGANRG